MNLYLLSQEEYDGYDTYDACVVCAATAEDAVKIQPGDEWDKKNNTWTPHPEAVQVVFIGVAAEDIPEGTVVIGSFNAG